MSEKGLLVIYSPQHLIQFIWYYCTCGQNKKWDALCLPNGFSAQNIKQYCENTGIFETVFFDKTYYLQASLKQRAATFAKMLGASCTGRKVQYIKKFLRGYINPDDYDEINVLSDFGIISGAFTALSDTKRVVVMEDGMADYNERTFRNIYRRPINPINAEGFLLAALGYANVAYFYPMKASKNCIKYASRPERMQYRDYREIRTLYDFGKTDMPLYHRILANTYADIADESLFQKADCIVFTTPFEDYTEHPEPYVEQIQNHIATNCRSILLKKHPRDKTAYCFEGCDCYEIPQTVPSEALFSYLQGKQLFFADTSSILLNIEKNAEVECLYFSGLHEESVTGGTYEKYPSLEEYSERLAFFGLENLTVTPI